MKWKRIAGYEDYEISDTGLVRSLKRGGTRVLSPRKNGRNGYLFVSLCKEGKAKHIFVHRLVAEAFVPNPLGLETVNHKDEDKTNNQVSNLEWLTRGDNVRYSNDMPVLQFDRLGNLVSRFPSLNEAARQTGIAAQSICSVCNGKRKTAGGYGWQFA